MRCSIARSILCIATATEELPVAVCVRVPRPCRAQQTQLRFLLPRDGEDERCWSPFRNDLQIERHFAFRRSGGRLPRRGCSLTVRAFDRQRVELRPSTVAPFSIASLAMRSVRANEVFVFGDEIGLASPIHPRSVRSTQCLSCPSVRTTTDAFVGNPRSARFLGDFFGRWFREVTRAPWRISPRIFFPHRLL